MLARSIKDNLFLHNYNKLDFIKKKKEKIASQKFKYYLSNSINALFSEIWDALTYIKSIKKRFILEIQP